MRFSWMFVATVLLVLLTEARCKRKFDGDFEFAEEVELLLSNIDMLVHNGANGPEPVLL
ncbi:testican-2 [Apis cerana cerana]|uniref:Testican-2 n=1 Tax=Apis cerana cerana TaxID=94128 RepID=A0A2A3EBM9_APICC|nr:testican-2 [Apis cerana cerana]